MRQSSRFQTGGSQKSKDAIELHKRFVDRIVLKLELEEKLFDRKFIRKLISDPSFVSKILARTAAEEGGTEEYNCENLSTLINSSASNT